MPLICRQFAQQLEFQGEHAQATQFYQRALTEGAQLTAAGAAARARVAQQVRGLPCLVLPFLCFHDSIGFLAAFAMLFHLSVSFFYYALCAPCSMCSFCSHCRLCTVLVCVSATQSQDKPSICNLFFHCWNLGIFDFSLVTSRVAPPSCPALPFQAAALGPYAHSAAASLQLREGMSAADAAAIAYEPDAATEARRQFQMI